MLLVRYLESIPPGRVVLWCYLIWWTVTVVLRFDPLPALWLNSLGISAVIGIGLLLSISRNPSDANAANAARAGASWQTFRLFAMPFCVSSFSSLIKGQGYWLIFPPRWRELVLSFGCCGGFVLLVALLKAWRARRARSTLRAPSQ